MAADPDKVIKVGALDSRADGDTAPCVGQGKFVVAEFNGIDAALKTPRSSYRWGVRRPDLLAGILRGEHPGDVRGVGWGGMQCVVCRKDARGSVRGARAKQRGVGNWHGNG